jgi:hypothetical protein
MKPKRFASRFSTFAAVCAAVVLTCGALPAETRIGVMAAGGAGAEKLSPLVELRLSKRAHVVLVERNAIEAVLRERQLQTVLAAGAPDKRAALGKLLKADLLVFLAGNEQPKPHVRVMICETQRGLRLVSEVLLPGANIEADVDAAVKHVETAAKKRKEATADIVAVPPLVNNSLTREADRFQGALARIVESDLLRRPGLVVVELDEAKAIGREAAVGGAAGVERRLPLYLTGEFRFEGGGENRRAQFTWKLLRGDKELDRRHEQDLAEDKLSDRLRQSAVDLVDKALGKSDVPPDAEAEAQQLAARARTFADVGAWEEALAMAEASLLSKPGQPAMHERALRAMLEIHLARREQWRMKTYKPRQEAVQTALAQMQSLSAALPHFEACWRELGLGNAEWCVSDKYWTAVDMPPLTPELREAALNLYRERQEMVQRVLKAKAAAAMARKTAPDAKSKTPGKRPLDRPPRYEDGIYFIWRWTEPPCDPPENGEFFSHLMRGPQHPTSTGVDRDVGEDWLKKKLPEICANRLRLLREYGDLIDYASAKVMIRLYHDGGKKITDPVYVKFLEDVKALPGFAGHAKECLEEIAKEPQRLKDMEERAKELAKTPPPRDPPKPKPKPAPAPVTNPEVAFHPLTFRGALVGGRPQFALVEMPDDREYNPLHTPMLAVFPAGEKCDVFLRSGRQIHQHNGSDYVDNQLFLMKEKGRLQLLPLQITPSRVVLRSGSKLDVEFKHLVCWDGRYVWAMSAGEKGPLAAIDPSNGKIWKCGPTDGLPPSSSCGVVALGPGEVCVAGYFGRLWVAIVRFEPRKGFKVEIIHEAREVPKTYVWNALSPERNSPTLAEPITFVSLLTAAGADGAPPQRRVVVGRYCTENLDGPGPLLVDPDTRTVTAASHAAPAPWFSHGDALYWRRTHGQALYNPLIRFGFPDFKPEPGTKMWMRQEEGAWAFHQGQFHVFGMNKDQPQYCVAASLKDPLAPLRCEIPKFSVLDLNLFVSRHYGLLLSCTTQLYQVEFKRQGARDGARDSLAPQRSPLDRTQPTRAPTPAGTRPGGKDAADAKPETSPVPAAKNLRTWKSAAGASSVEAELVKMSAGKVTLRKKDGSTVTIPIDKMSAEDQEYIRQRLH